MKKLILTILITQCIMIANITGQSTNNNRLIIGEWYVCGLKNIQINDTVTFVKNDSTCMNLDCLFLKWIINENGKFISGFQQGCKDTKIGYDLKRRYKWTLENESNLLKIKKEDLYEIYKLLEISNVNIKVQRIR